MCQHFSNTIFNFYNIHSNRVIQQTEKVDNIHFNSPGVATSQVNAVCVSLEHDRVLSRFHQHGDPFDAAGSAARTTTPAFTQTLRRSAAPADDLSNNAPEVDVDGAVQHHVRREIGQQQTVGDVDSRPEAEIRCPVPSIRVTLQNEPQTTDS